MATPATEAVYVSASGPQEPVPSPMMATPPQLSSEQASVGATAAEAAFNQPERSMTASPRDIEMTGTVQASLAEPARPGGPASDLVDLNRASFEQLNSLKGAGALGRAIIKGRPYKSVDDLVKKKVMRRTVFEKIKDQVKVQ
ncbi:helix-hairpin-helix domain-containing protein [Microvirga sp. BT688]|nr:helix-hairpin-helix domain-containing protein [Microvirga sp.]